MKKRTGFIVIGLIVVVSVLATIAIINNEKKRIYNDSNTPHEELTYVVLKDAVDISDYQKLEYKNIHFDDNFAAYVPESLYQSSIYLPNLYSLNKKNVNDFMCSLLSIYDLQDSFSEDDIDNSLKYYPYGSYYDHENTHAGLGCTGFMYFDTEFENTSDIEDSYLSIANNGNYEKVYDLREYEAKGINYRDDEYELYNGTVTVGEAIDLVNEYITKCNEILEYDIDIRPASVWICKGDFNEKYYMLVKCCMYYFDTPVMDTYDTLELEGTLGTLSTFMTGDFSVYGNKLSDIRRFALEPGYPLVENKNNIESIISMKDALRLVHEYFSEQINFSLKYATIEYVPIYRGNLQDNNIFNIDYNFSGTIYEADKSYEFYEILYQNSHQAACPEATIHSYNYYDVQPFWVFVANRDYFKESMILVNCITGEVHWIDNGRGQ